jgi:3-oxoacyl-[acyl-carrier protein] reductase
MTSRHTLVCGSTGPLGRGLARALAARGHRLALHYRSAEEVASGLARELGPGHVAVGGDLRTREGAEAVVRQAREALGGDLDAVVNAAWPAVPSTAQADAHAVEVEMALDGYRMHTNLVAASLPSLRRTRGSFVLLGAAAATRHHPRLGLFAAGKAAAVAAAGVLALEEGPGGVRVNVVSPGRVDVDSGDLAESDPAFETLDTIGALRRALPLPTAAEVGAVVAWLAGPDATAVTGQVVAVAGGEQT